jgi:invasion protein IalB
MRNTIIGLVLGVVFLGALFAVSRPGPRQEPQRQPPPPTPARIAAAIGDDFVGHVKIGAWRLGCGKGEALPTPPALKGHEDARPRSGPPPGWRIPRCRVGIGMHSPQNPSENLRMTFRLFGFKRVLGIFLRLPTQDVSTGDTVTLRVDGTRIPVPVRACSAQFCLAIYSVRFADLPAIEGARKMMIEFSPSGGGKTVAIPVPTAGLAEALKVQRRIDK